MQEAAQQPISFKRSYSIADESTDSTGELPSEVTGRSQDADAATPRNRSRGPVSPRLTGAPVSPAAKEPVNVANWAYNIGYSFAICSQTSRDVQ